MFICARVYACVCVTLRSVCALQIFHLIIMIITIIIITSGYMAYVVHALANGKTGAAPDDRMDNE